ncbi:MAG TPA: 2-oxo acid dehydrogenase subunit E2, partial [Gammaproteobacteria bacterium]|nr:2-oxo acid dehydrogenase subunit E2 [Gammaproteobacteria bacterium]
MKEVLVPDIGDFSGVDVIDVVVKAGDTIQKEDHLITLETDKAAMEIPAPLGGKIHEVKIKKGDKVSKGDLILLLETAESAAEKKPQATKQIQPLEIEKPSKISAKAELEGVLPQDQLKETLYAGPATRRMARELEVDLTKIRGTGRKGRILTKDVADFVKAQMKSGSGLGFTVAPPLSIDFKKFGPIEVTPLNRIKKLAGQYLHRNWVSIPHVTHFEEADITELENYRHQNKEKAKAQGLRLTPLVFLMKAAVESMRKYPQFNSSLSSNGEELIYKKYFHIGVAVDTKDGL